MVDVARKNDGSAARQRYSSTATNSGVDETPGTEAPKLSPSASFASAPIEHRLCGPRYFSPLGERRSFSLVIDAPAGEFVYWVDRRVADRRAWAWGVYSGSHAPECLLPVTLPFVDRLDRAAVIFLDGRRAP